MATHSSILAWRISWTEEHGFADQLCKILLTFSWDPELAWASHGDGRGVREQVETREIS